MSLSEGLNVISTALGSIVNVLMSISLFGIPLGVFFIGAFIVSVVDSFVFSVDSSERKGKGE